VHDFLLVKAEIASLQPYMTPFQGNDGGMHNDMVLAN